MLTITKHVFRQLEWLRGFLERLFKIAVIFTQTLEYYRSAKKDLPLLTQ